MVIWYFRVNVKRRFKGKQRRSFLTNNRPENVSFKPKKKKEFCKERHLVYFPVLWHIHLFHIKLLWGNHILSTLCMQHWWRSSQAAAKLQEQQLFVKQNMNTVCMLWKGYCILLPKGLFSSHFATLCATIYNLITKQRTRLNQGQQKITLACNVLRVKTVIKRQSIFKTCFMVQS